jgi:hypothetical protein
LRQGRRAPADPTAPRAPGGLVAAIEFIGATEGVVWIHDGAWRTAQSVTAIAERIAARENDPPIRVAAPDRYLSSEATGIIRTEAGPRCCWS